MKKFVSCILSAALAITSIAGGVTAYADDTHIFSDYENGTDNWSGRGTAVLSLESDSYYSGSKSLHVSGRTDTWNGAAIELPADKFRAGESYSFSAAVLHMENDNATMKMTLEYTSGGQVQYDEIAMKPVDNEKWADLSNESYTIPSGAEKLTLYFELLDSVSDFYIDSFTAAKSGTASPVVDGKGVVKGVTGQPETDSIRGDINGDSVIDSFDIANLRQIIVREFAGSTQTYDKSICDIDGNGTVQVSDLVLVQKYVLGQINEFPEIIVTTTTTTTVTTTTTRNEITTTTTVVGGGNYMDKVAGDMQTAAPASFTQNRSGVDYGVMEKKTYFSKDGNMNKSMNVLLPAGYNPAESYPVLFVLHGIFGNEDSMPQMGIQTMLGNLVADGEAEKMIVVFPAMFTGSGSPGFTAESSKKYDLIREDIENSIMPFLEQNYSIKKGRENTAITGFSMGGREALYTGITRSEVYGYIGAACPAPGIFPTVDQYMTHEGCMSENEFRPATSPYMLMISAAAHDGTVGTYPMDYHQVLENNNVQHLWQIIADGDHGGRTVTPHMYNFLRFIFKD